jgi:hypothetical protein
MKKLLFHITLIGAVVLAVFLFNFFSIGCPIRAITHIPCPTCGVTRSLAALISLDFAESFYYNPMTIPLCLTLMIVFHRKKLRIHPICYHILVIGMALLVFAVYLVRLFTHSIP